MSANISGHRIKAARTLQKPCLTQDELIIRMQAKGIHMSKATLACIELGKRRVTDLELLAFAKALNVTMTWLLEDED